MVYVVEDRHVPGDHRVVTDANALNHAHDTSIIETNPVTDDQLGLWPDVPSARTADMNIVPYLNPAIPEDKRRSTLEVQPPSDACAAITEQRLAIE